VSLSPDDKPDPEPGLATPAPAPGRTQEPVGGGGAVAAGDSSLTRDVDEVERGRPERAFNIGATLGILVTVAAVIFVLQNRQSTTFDWLWLDFELPLWTALVGAVGVGIVLVLTILAVHARRRQRIRRRRDAAGRLRRALVRKRLPAETGP
jgi:uncharacterized integral membrane protein